MIIKRVDAWKVKDSRGQETIEVSVNNSAEASSPNGKSTGKYETKSYYKSLNYCIKFLNKWDEEIEIKKFEDLVKVEDIISNKLRLRDVKKFGANALYAFESAILKALAHEEKKELWQVINPKARKIPYPVGNVVGGGLHSSAIKIHPNFQEFLVIPKAKKFSDNLKVMNNMYSILKNKLRPHGVNDEGAWLVSSTDEEVMEALKAAKKETINKFKINLEIGIDAATSTLFKKRNYIYNGEKFNSKDQEILIGKLILNYQLGYVEDPFEEKDFYRFSKLQKAAGKRCLIVGDDLTATQYSRTVEAIKMKSINAMIIKPNQNGSLLELKRIFDTCKKHKIKTVLSHRSGETLDDALSDYAVGFGADYIKCGVATKWREAKLKRLLEIEKRIK